MFDLVALSYDITFGGRFRTFEGLQVPIPLKNRGQHVAAALAQLGLFAAAKSSEPQDRQKGGRITISTMDVEQACAFACHLNRELSKMS